MQLPGNPRPEDKYISTSDQESNEVKWILFGIHDGHEYVDFELELTHVVDGKEQQHFACILFPI